MKRNVRNGLLLSLILLGARSGLVGQPDSAGFNYWDIPLDSLTSMPKIEAPSVLEDSINEAVSVATRKALSRRNSPNVITVITEDEIRNSGARDLIDVLRMVPGFTFGLDGRGQVGLGIRGNWAHEGKVLLLMDGQEMNEIYTAKLFFGNRFPVQLIKRIEIIRGPGSAAYGGFAEFGVINIITLSSEEYSGLHAGYAFGQMDDARAMRNRYFYIGKNWKKLTINYSSFTGKGQRSNRDHFGFYPEEAQDRLGIGAYASLKGASDINPNVHNFYVSWKGLSLRSLVDFYNVRDVSLLDSLNQRPLQNGIRAAFTELKWKINVSEKFTFTPQYIATWQYPSIITRGDSFQQRQIQQEINRNRLILTGNYKKNHRRDYLFGLDAYRDYVGSQVNQQTILASPMTTSLYNLSTFGQAILRLPTFHLTAGMRLDYNTQYGFAFSPRLALTRRHEGFHFKLLIDGAYRAPTIGNIALSFNGEYQLTADSTQVELTQQLQPERTFSIEGEMGYKINEKTYITVNLYNMTLFNPIVLNAFQDATIRGLFGERANILVYQNFRRAGTRGLEVDFQYKDSKLNVDVNYSFYSSGQQTTVSPYSVATFSFDPEERKRQDTGMLLAFPHHRLNMSVGYHLSPRLTLTTTAHGYGARFGYDVEISGTGPEGVTGVLVKEPPALLMNVYLRQKDFLVRNLDAGFGVYNLFNSQYRFIQPYFGLTPPLPDRSRTLQFHIGYRLGFVDKKKKDSEK